MDQLHSSMYRQPLCTLPSGLWGQHCNSPYKTERCFAVCIYNFKMLKFERLNSVDAKTSPSPKTSVIIPHMASGAILYKDYKSPTKLTKNINPSKMAV